MSFTVPLPLRLAALVLVTTAFYTYVGQMVPQKEVYPPEEIAIPTNLSTAEMVQVGQKVVDALFKAYFEDAKDVGDPEILLGISNQCGVKGWPDGVDEKEVAALEASMRGFGIQAVPTFIFDRKFGVSGAHPPEALAEAIREASAHKGAPADR